jgi:signal transduction histidine kinase
MLVIAAWGDSIMSFWQQLNQLLSETPGNLVYHLVTLFAIQATLAIAVAQWRRERTPDGLTRRLALGAGGLLLARVALLGVSLWLLAQNDQLTAARLLPPLEQALNTVTALIVVWMVAPRPASMRRLPDTVAVLVFFAIAVTYGILAPSWAPSEGLTYNASEQSLIWGIAQLAILGVGALWVAARRFPSGGLRFFPLVLLFIGHAMQFWDFPERFPGNTEIPFWIRLGHLAAFPLLAVLAYRHSMQQLLVDRLANRPALEQLAESLRLATRVLVPEEPAESVREGVRMAYDLLQPAAVGIALARPERPAHLQVITVQGEDATQWELNRDAWPAFRVVVEQEHPVELLPNGLGARQLHDLYEELGIRNAAALELLPMRVGEAPPLGVFFVAATAAAGVLSRDRREALPALAAYLAHVVARSRLPLLPAVPPVTPPSVSSGRLIALEEERDRARSEARELRDQLEETESRLTAAQQQVRDLAATVEALEGRPQSERVQALENEVATLREALREAEEALALAASGEGELSAEWVTMTISRYSGDLEEAQVRIAELEEELEEREPEERRVLMTALAQELRTPLTSVAGYTDLMLGETLGILGTRQRDFLERIRANVDRTVVLLDQIVQVAAAPVEPAPLSDVEEINLQELVDNALSTIITQVRKKSLRLYLDIAPDLPPVPANRDALGQVLIHLLSNASQASLNAGAITIQASVEAIKTHRLNGSSGEDRFIHLSIQDSGEGIPPEALPHVFDAQHRAERPLVPGLGDTGAGLHVARTLVDAHGGRMWVDSQQGVGSTFTILLPVAANGNGPAAAKTPTEVAGLAAGG